MWDFKQYRENVALIQETGDVVTYGELIELADKLSHNIPERSLVFCLCRNTLASVIGYVALTSARHVPLMLDAALDADQLNGLVKLYRPQYMWLPSDMVSGFDDVNPIYNSFDYTLVKIESSQPIALHEDLALLLTTSGSTGSRKLVRLSYENIASNTKSIIEFLNVDQNERAITTLPMSYTYGLSIINSHLWAGASIVVTEKSLVQKEFWQQIKSSCATSFGGVPYTFEMLIKLRFFKMELPSLRYMTQAGGRLSADLHERIASFAQDTSRRFYVMYGQTEATARISYLPHDLTLEKCGSIGVAIPGGELYLVDESGNKISDCDSIGELGYVGQNVSLGYAEKRVDLARGDDNKGILLTGDLAKVDNDGYYWIVGRKKRYLKVFGNRVSLDETEEMLKNRFDSTELACSGVDDKVTVYVTNNAIVGDVKDYLSDKTGLNRMSLCVKHVGAIPKNESGKTVYAALDGVR